MDIMDAKVEFYILSTARCIYPHFNTQNRHSTFKLSDSYFQILVIAIG